MKDLIIALPKGRLGENSTDLFKKIGLGNVIDMKSRKLVFTDKNNKITFMLLKNADVTTYVENGVADIGIIGKDMIMESGANVYQLYNLDLGRCKMSVAGIKGQELFRSDMILRIATKFTRIAKEYFEERGQRVELVKLNGSVELAPLVGLSDVIVDLVETGNTLKANGLEILEDMHKINAQIISNKISYKFKRKRINEIIKKIEEVEGRND